VKLQSKEIHYALVLLPLLFFYVIALINSVITSDASLAFSSIVSPLACFLFIKLILFFDINRPDRKRVYAIYSCTLLINLIFMLYHSAYFNALNPGHPFHPGGDAESYFNLADDLSTSWRNGSFLHFHQKYMGFTYLLTGWLFFLKNIFGTTSVLSLKIFSATLSSLLPCMTYLLAKRYYTEKEALTTAILLAAPGIFTFFSSVLLRDILVGVLSVTIILLLQYSLQLKSALHKTTCFFLTALIAYLIFLLRLEALCYVLIGAYLALLLNLSYKQNITVALLLVIVLFSMAPFVYERITSLQGRYTAKLVNQSDNIDGVGRKLYTSTNPITLVARFIYTTLCPIPPVSKTSDILPYVDLALGACIWYLLTVPFFIGTKEIWKSRKNIPLIFMAYGLLLYGVFAPTGIRHKLQALPFMYILAARGIHLVKFTKLIKHLAITLTALGLLFSLYVLIKTL
jgi:hypothetical protein